MEFANTGDKVTLSLDEIEYLGMAPVSSEMYSQFKFFPILVSARPELPSDFSSLCVFTIELDSGASDHSNVYTVFYGDIIRLKHTASGRYLGTSDISSPEVSNKFVCQLYEEFSAKCQFLINPGLRIRSEGEPIYYEDKVILSDTSEENYVGFASETVVSQFLPVGWKINRFSLNTDKEFIRGGDMVRLFHKEIEGFLQVRPNDLHLRSNLNRVLDFQIEKMSKKQRFLLGIKLKAPNKPKIENKAVLTIWQVEKQHIKCGDPINWSEPFRMKHMVYQVYLKLKGNLISYTTKCNDPNTLFEAVPVAGQGPMSNNALMRFRHVASGLFLKTENLEAGQFSVPSDKIKIVRCAKESIDEHVFMVSMCKNLQFDYLLFAKGIVEELNSLFGQMKNTPNNELTGICSQLSSVIDHMRDFILGKVAYSKDDQSERSDWRSKLIEYKVHSVGSQPIKRRQKTLKEFLALETILGLIDYCWTFVLYKRNSESQVWKLCKKAHALLKLMIEGNASNISSVIELGAINMMFEQISTGWNPCISEIVNSTSEFWFDKTMVNRFIDQISPEECPSKIINFLASICSKDKSVQKWVIELLVGSEISPRTVPSNLIFHTKVHNGNTVLILTDRNGLARPKSKKEGQNQGENKQYPRNWVNLEEFLQGKSEPVKYYRSLLNLYRAACENQNSWTQRIISGLITPEHILLVLRSQRISSYDKQLYLDLLDELYVNSATLGTLKSSVLPSILVWNSNHHPETEKLGKMFCSSSQPFMTIMSDWVSSWESFKALDNSAAPSQTYTDEAEVSVEEIILKERLNLYNYVMNAFVDMLYTLVSENTDFSNCLFSAADSEIWQSRLGYWKILCKTAVNLIKRGFFEEGYLESPEKVKIGQLPQNSELMSMNRSLIEPLIPIDTPSPLRSLRNICINMIIQSSPTVHYTLASEQSIEMYNKLFHTEEGQLSYLLCELKRDLVILLQIIQDQSLANKAYQLWDGSFKSLYKGYFTGLGDLMSIEEKKILRIYPDTDIELNKVKMYEENNFFTKQYSDRRARNSDNGKSFLVSFRERCQKNPNLAKILNDELSQSPNEVNRLSHALLDILLYSVPTLVIQSTNMLYRLFNQHREIGRIYAEATLLLDEKYYKVYKLLQSHFIKLNKITRNFTTFPKKAKDIVDFYRIFKAGNPLTDSKAKTAPGLIDLCYTGVDLDPSQYTVFNRNRLLFSLSSRRNAENPEAVPEKNGVTKKTMINMWINKKTLKELYTMKEAAKNIEELSKSLMVGKLDIWAKNQELIKTVGLHHKIIELLSRARQMRTEDADHQFCQDSMNKVCYDFLYFFVWENDENTLELTNTGSLNILFSQIDQNESVPKLLTEIIVDNDVANELVTEEQVKKSINNLRLSDDEYFPVRYIALLKTLVESDIGPKPSRQKQVIENLMKKSNELNKFLFKNKNGQYDLDMGLEEYEIFKKTVMTGTNDQAKVLDPRDSEKKFNFHIQMVDLLGLCSRGHNISSINFCRSLYSDIDSILRPLVTPHVPLCIKASFTRFFHGVYFSDSFHKCYYDASVWSMFSYSTFKELLVDIGKNLQYLLSLYEKEESRKNKTNSYVMSDLDSDEVEELKTFLELEEYGDYIFDIVLPFLTDLIDFDIEAHSSEATEMCAPMLNWKETEGKILLDKGYPMTYLLRALVFIIIKLTKYNLVLYKENCREAINDFLKEVMNYINDHHDDESNLLERDEAASKQMQVSILTTINLLENAIDKRSADDGDLNLDIIKERKEQSFIKEKALPQFMKAIFNIMEKSKAEYKEMTAVLSSQMPKINSEFSEYVSLILQKLESYINWHTSEVQMRPQLGAVMTEEEEQMADMLDSNNNNYISLMKPSGNSKQNKRVNTFNEDFAKWTAYGGKYLYKLIELLTDISVEGETESDVFHLRSIQALLLEFPKRSSLQKRQLALADLGIINMIMSTISRAKEPDSLTPYLKAIIPEVIKIGSNVLALGTTKIQNMFMDLYHDACKKLTKSQYFLVSLKVLLRELKHNVKYLNTTKGDPFLSKLTPNLLSFVKNMCEGHHRSSQEFLSIQPQSLSNIDLLSELSAILVSSTEKIQKNIILMPGGKFGETRHLIAWHKQDCKLPDIGDVKLVSQLLVTLSECIQGPCIQNQLSLTMSKCCKNFTPILEFLGAFFYKKMHSTGHGMNIYLNYLQNNPQTTDMEDIQINQFCQLMEFIAHNPSSDPRNLVLLIDHNSEAYYKYIAALDDLEQNILAFYSSMIEGNQNRSVQLASGAVLSENIVSRIPSYIYGSFNGSLLIENLQNYWNSGLLAKAKLREEENIWSYKLRKKVFLYYSFLAGLSEEYEGASQLRELLDLWQKDFGVNMKDVVEKIEVQNANNELEVVYFPKPTIARLYWNARIVNELKDDIMYKIKRDSPEDKLMDFQDYSTDLIILMQNLKFIALMPRRYPILGSLYKFVANNYNYWSSILVVLTIMINLALIFSTSGIEYLDFEHYQFIKIKNLGYIHFFFSVVSFLSYTLMNGILAVQTSMKRYKSRTVSLPKPIIKLINFITYFLSCFRLWKKLQIYVQKIVSRKVRIPDWIWGFYYYISSYASIYHIVFAFMSVLGAFFEPMFFAFHLIILIRGIRMVLYVLRSVTTNLNQVAATFLLAIIILFWFVIIAYNIDTFRGAYGFEDQMENDNFALFLKTHLAYGFTVNPIWNDSIPVSGMIYVLIYFILINLIMTAIVSGIIIDTFSEMRANSQLIQDDTHDRCFICNINKDQFEKMELDFSKHIKRDHHMWNYMFFRIYLESMDPTEMTGLEHYVFNCLTANSINFMPIKKAIAIEGNEDRVDLPAVYKKIEALEKKLDTTQKELKQYKEKNSSENKKIIKGMGKIATK